MKRIVSFSRQPTSDDLMRDILFIISSNARTEVLSQKIRNYPPCAGMIIRNPEFSSSFERSEHPLACLASCVGLSTRTQDPTTPGTSRKEPRQNFLMLGRKVEVADVTERSEIDPMMCSLRSTVPAGTW